MLIIKDPQTLVQQQALPIKIEYLDPLKPGDDGSANPPIFV